MIRKKDKDKEEPIERRQYVRIEKNFIMNYYDIDTPSLKRIATQLKNISKGGMCFITEQAYTPSTVLKIELRTPYLADVTEFEGTVLESHEKVPQIIYETRLKFKSIDPQAELLLDKLEEYFRHELKIKEG